MRGEGRVYYARLRIVSLLEARVEVSPVPLNRILFPEGFGAYNPQDPRQRRTVEFYTNKSPELARLIGDVDNVNELRDASALEGALCRFFRNYFLQMEVGNAVFQSLREDER